MKQNTYLQIAAITLLFLMASCGNKTKGTEETGRAGKIQQCNLVQIMELQPTTFTKQLVGNGKLTAFRKAELSFRINGEIEQLPVSNGMRIVPGHLIAAVKRCRLPSALATVKPGT
jgi:multidrug efflux pump subunit AcrA (membrane-fusion protein)